MGGISDDGYVGPYGHCLHLTTIIILERCTSSYRCRLLDYRICTWQCGCRIWLRLFRQVWGHLWLSDLKHVMLCLNSHSFFCVNVIILVFKYYILLVMLPLFDAFSLVQTLSRNRLYIFCAVLQDLFHIINFYNEGIAIARSITLQGCYTGSHVVLITIMAHFGVTSLELCIVRTVRVSVVVACVWGILFSDIKMFQGKNRLFQ